MQKYQDSIVKSQAGIMSPLSGAVVTIVNTSGGSSTMYSDNGITVVPSVITDANGFFSFYAADGLYTITGTQGGVIIFQRTGVELQDTSTLDNDIAARPTYATLAATNGAALIGSNDGAGGSLWTTVAGFISKIRSAVGASIVGDNTGGALWTNVRGFITYLLSSAGSSLVGFIQGGVGAAPRTLQAKNRDIVCALDYYANGVSGALVDQTGVTDSVKGIQAAIDWVIYRNLPSGMTSGGDVYIGDGIFKTSDTLHLGYGEAFHSVTLRGAGQRFRGEAKFSGTAIVPTFNDRPAIAISGGRATRVKDLTIVGLNLNWINSHNMGTYAAPTIDDLIASNWVDTTFPAASSSRYAPYAAIAIDPYAGTAPATAYPNVTFPSWSGITTQYGKVYSSNTMIENVGIHGFVVGVANQPCNADGNGDYTRLRDCWIEFCQYAVSIGNTQSRLVHLQDCQITQVHTAIVTGVNGVQLGLPSILCDNTELSFIINWANVPNMSYGGTLTFRNCYGETIYNLGSCNAGIAQTLSPIVFDSCEFNFSSWDWRGLPTSIFQYQGGGGIVFRSCIFNPAFNVKPNFYVIEAPRADLITIDNCMVNAGASATHYYEKYGVNATMGIVISYLSSNFAKFTSSCAGYYNLNTGASMGRPRNCNETATETNRSTCMPIYAKQIRCAEGFTSSDPGFPFAAAVGAYGKSTCASITTTGNTTTVDLTGSLVGTWQLTQSGGDVGDIVWDDETRMTFVVAARTGNVVTLIAQTGLNTSGNIVTAPTKTGSFWAMNCRLYTFGYFTIGDLTSANVNVTNVARIDGYNAYLNDAINGLQVGDFVFGGTGSAIQKVGVANANIASIGAGTFAMGSGALYTATRQRMDLFVKQPPANNT